MGYVVCCENVTHHFGNTETDGIVLNNVTLSLAPGQTSLLLGPSGSGKTTLLSILGCLLKPRSGRLWFGDREVTSFDSTALANLRREKIGFVFQHSRLLPFLTIKENLDIIGRNNGMPQRDLDQRITELAERLDLLNQLQKLPAKLSGGQRQRAGVARAILQRPALLLADEPTAALDWKYGQEVVELLVSEAHETNAAVLTVTHDVRLIPLFDRTLKLEAGNLEGQS